MSSPCPIAIITGAAQGIGFHLAQAFAQKGFRVCAVDVLPMSFPPELSISCYTCDLAQGNEIQALFQTIRKDWKRAHVLINNAAKSMFHVPLDSITMDDFESLIKVNLSAAFACCKYFAQLNQGCTWGRIINMSSTRHHQNEADWEAYGASKGGIVSLSNSLCVSLSQSPITVNTISPGWIHTGDESELRPIDHLQHPSQRVGKPADIARACLFLCEEENDFINGAHLFIDGGMSKRMFYAE